MRGHGTTLLVGLAIAVTASLGLPADIAAQTGTVEGEVVSARTGQPLANAQVYIPGTNIGRLSGRDGRFSIPNVPVGETVVRVQMLGYARADRTATVRAGETVSLNYQLEREAVGLDEVVVTGTAGQARRREVGNTIAQINVPDVTEPVINMDGLLAGRAAGVEVPLPTGQAGSGSAIRLRGNVSATMSNQPMIYIDGVRVRSDGYPKNMQVAGSTFRSSHNVSSPLNDLNPADIERIEIVRGPAATTLYGTEAAAGVIQIFTKRGAEGVASWTAQIDQGFDRLGQFGPDHVPYMYLDHWMQTGHRQRYSLSVSGGTDVVRYYASGQFRSMTGVIPNETEEGMVVRGNFAFTPLNNLNIDWNTSYTRNEVQNVASGNNGHAFLLNVFRQETNYLGSADPADISRFLDWEIGQELDRLVTGVTATYTPTQNFSNRFRLGMDRAAIDMQQLKPFGFVGLPQGRKSVRSWSDRTITAEYVGSLDLALTGDLRTRFSFGGQSATNEEVMVGGRADGFAGPVTPTLGGGAETLARESRLRVVNAGVFVENLIDFRDRYFITTGLRVDGNSAFGRDFGLQAYPKVSASYVVSDEAFWPQRLGEVKLRAAYGHAGRAPGAFDPVRTWSPVSWIGQVAFMPGNVGNPQLGPERTAETEVGVDAALFGGRLSTEFTYYHQETRDALMSVRQIPSLGFSSSQLENVGLLRNTGIELTLNGTVLETPTVSWDLGGTVTTNRSLLVDLGGEPDFALGGFRGRAVEGHPVPVMWAYKVENPGEFAEPIISDQQEPYGPNYPTHIFGINTTLRLPAGIILTSRGEYQGGHYILDHGGSLLAGREGLPQCDAAVEAMREGRRDEVTALMRARCDTSIRAHDFFIYPADHFRLRDITLQVPITRIIPGTTNTTFTASLQNAWLWLNEEFFAFDPSMQGRGGFDEGGMNTAVRYMDEQLPTPRSLTFSIRASF